MIKKIEHIGIAVSNLKASESLFEKLLGEKSYKQERVISEGVTTSFFKLGDQKIELLTANTKGSPIQTFIEKRKERNQQNLKSDQVQDCHSHIPKKTMLVKWGSPPF